jgi:flagellin-specific chaperone FliS
MAITAERLNEFIRLYEEEFQEGLNEDEAREIANRLVELYQLLAEPLPAE